jgi:hypothetical protein
MAGNILTARVRIRGTRPANHAPSHHAPPRQQPQEPQEQGGRGEGLAQAAAGWFHPSPNASATARAARQAASPGVDASYR